MTNRIFRLLFLVLYSVGIISTVQAQEIVHVACGENYTLGKTSINMSQGAKPNRTRSAGRGVIQCNYNGISDREKTAIETAANIWCAYLQNGDTIKIDVEYDESMSYDILIDVLHQQLGNTLYPLSLLQHQRLESGHQTHGIIKLNPTSKWDVDAENGGTSKRNLVYAALRSIARIMGFGGSLDMGIHGYVVLKNSNFSPFEKMIISSEGDSLSAISVKRLKYSAALNSFVQPSCGYLYVDSINAKHRLYAPPVFESDKSLKYLMNSLSLMNYEEADSWGTEVDDLTIELLNKIGWNLSEHSEHIEIKGTDIDESGIASAYASHHFCISPANVSIANAHWEYRLPLKNGGYQTVMNYNGAELTTPAITNEHLYLIDSEGDIHAKILFNGTVNGQDCCLEYNLTLELKPRIVKAEYTGITVSSEDPTYYDVIVNVTYQGAYYVYATVKEEYASSATAYSCYTPYYASMKMNTIFGGAKATVRIKVQNAYGTAIKTITIPRQFDENGNPLATTDIHVYAFDGNLIGHIHQIQDLQKFEEPGIYVLRYYENGNYLKTQKVKKK